MLKQTRPTLLRAVTAFAGAILFATGLQAQADLAGRYIGSMNTRVSAGPLNLESGFGLYIADITAARAIDLNGGALSGETGSILLRNNANAGDAGQYTVRVTNSDGTIPSQAATVSLSQTASTLRNISVRTNASLGQVITPGFVIRGSGSKQVLIRAIGPGLVPYGLTGVMPNPKVTVYDSN